MTEQMKPSGIGWIKEIPQSWELNKVKYLATEQGTLFLDGDWIESDVIVESGIRYLTTGNVGAGFYKEQGSGYITLKTFDELHCLKVFPGDLMISRLNEPIGRACIVPEGEDYYVVAVDNVILRPNRAYDKKFIMYAMNTEGYAEHGNIIARGATMSRVSRSQLGQFWLAFPKLKEQQQIAKFLDAQCAKIDGIIADIEKQIDTLQKYKKSLITETVTKGLDKSAPMKNSKNKIIGMINAKWKVKKLKYIVATPITDGPHETPILLDDGIPFLSAESVKNGVLDFNYKRGYISESDHRIFCRKIKPQKGDVFVVKSGATTGNVGKVITDEEFSIWSPLALIRCDNKTVLQDFIYYCTLSNYFRQEVELSWSYGTQQNIGMGVLGNLSVVIPSAKEQQTLVEFLNVETKKIDNIINLKLSQLEKIQQHKKSLIYEYVTGKKRVTEVN